MNPDMGEPNDVTLKTGTEMLCDIETSRLNEHMLALLVGL
jgi:hypothetical protein